MPKGGKLTLKTEMEGQNVVFTFSDTGTGMSKEVMNKIWSPLFTTKAKGMGLGLPVCKRIVDAHRGKISVESSAGKGSTIRVTLPAEAKTSDEHLQISVNMPEQLLKTTAPAPAGRDNLPFWRSLSHKHKKEQDTDHSDQH
jgi:chemotaxis protein histidine kinase CheA